jgi:curved DNA-binding protein CbpA
MSDPISPYQLLGVSPTSSAKEIHAAYRRLARQFHPDVSTDPSGAAAMARINAAYEVLRSIHHLAPIGHESSAPGARGGAERGGGSDFERADAVKRYRSTMSVDPAKRTRRVDVRA